MEALAAVRDTLPVPAFIGAGAVRNAVWDALHDHANSESVSDIDVVFFEPLDLSLERDHALQAELLCRWPQYTWDVTNQAGVHLWYEQYFGRRVPASQTLSEVIATWPETATAVAVRLVDNGQLEFIAPFGLTDLMEMVVRWNPQRASREQYLSRVQQKQYRRRWPRVQVIPA
jgi:hypothetical protein